MKKAIVIIGLFISFIIIYLLQSNFFTWFTIAGVKPNVFVIFVLFIGLFLGKYYGLTCGVIFGLLLDIFISKNIGISAAMLGIIGLLGGILDKNFAKDSKLTIIIMVIASTIIYELGKNIANSIMFSFSLEIIKFLTILIIEIIYNVILTIILYPLMQRIGFYIQDIFKGNKILTRYF